MALTHIHVTAPEGKLTPVNTADAVEPGGHIMYVRPGEVRRVAYSQTTRRSVGRRDLLLCNLHGALVDSYDLASAPEEIPGGRRIITAAPAAERKRS